ncbi:DUF2807 domain-containing protein [Rhodocytophaga aerolata]|uniref:DUF2807 domain-containing protein n=1 Tax=Rhodocytophaga aerolata TaxID=455078 RepID=A0ABT8R9Q9_9BACT|nr:DUF2807 domain-containing protein [Rhodocytophaga aerolata]MDO1448821.1 DUF2807 domain-containing protein [Rhodocytophaga aerolata]
MNTWRLLAYLFLLNFSFQSCNQENAFDCVKSTGSIVQEERKLAPFHTIILEDNINLQLKPATSGLATIEAGKNLIPKIELRQKDDTLFISNKNTCEWVRSYKYPVSVTLTITPESFTLFHRGYGKVTSSEGLSVPDAYILSLDAGGNINLKLQTNSLILYSNSHALIELSGQATTASIWLNKSIGRVHAENLSVQQCSVEHGGSNEIRVLPMKELSVAILQNGNVAYYHEPEKLTSTIKGTGKLIKR